MILTMTIGEEMRKRIEEGEFGPLTEGISDQLRAIIDATAELAKQAKGEICSISGLWAGRGKVAYEGRTGEDLTIPAGSKILVFNNNKTDDKQPDLNLCYVED